MSRSVTTAAAASLPRPVRALRQRLAAAADRDPSGRVWRYVPYDQLSLGLGGLDAADPRTVGLVLVESAEKAGRRPYHRQKLALVLANQRQFAVEAADRGFAVRYRASERPIAEVLREEVAALGPLEVLEPAERELRADLAPLLAEGRLRGRPHDGWLTTPADFAAGGGPPWRMDTFYRHVRRRTGVLMDGAEPEGGRFSFDAENRRPWRGDPPAPEPPTFTPDAITLEVLALVASRFADHPGRLDPAQLPATAGDAERLWAWAKAECLPWFGPFEDALSSRSRGLFHTRISSVLNLHRLLPARVVAEAAAAPDVPLASREGFVRQILGWREFVRHVHAATDGFRALPGGGAPDALGATNPLPDALWGLQSGLRCLDEVVTAVWEDGWSHHITRLMVIGNLCTLLGVSPRALTDWFWVAYTDAYDWVVEPNVLGMATYATDAFTTKPYVSGAAYLKKMGAPCGSCAFDPGSNCPVTPMYWAFLARHADALGKNHRMAVPVAAARKRSPEQRARDAAVRDAVWARLAAREPVRPEDLP